MQRFLAITLVGLALGAVGCKSGKGDVEESNPLVDVCSTGDLDQCYETAAQMEKGGPEERRSALTAFQYGCLLEHADSCSGLARMYGHQNAEVSDRRVLDALESACQGGNADSCVQLGRRMEAEKAQDLFKTACDAGSGLGCHELADVYRAGWRFPGSLKKALELDEKACELGSTAGCVAAGQAYLFGSGVDPDESRGFEYLNPTCTDASGGGCIMLAKMYEDGIGVAPSAEKAANYHALAEKHAEAIVADSPSSAFLVFVDACSQGNELGCFDAAWFLAEGVEVQRNISTSRELFEQACSGGLQAACDRWKKIEPVSAEQRANAVPARVDAVEESADESSDEESP